MCSALKEANLSIPMTARLKTACLCIAFNWLSAGRFTHFPNLSPKETPLPPPIPRGINGLIPSQHNCIIVMPRCMEKRLVISNGAIRDTTFLFVRLKTAANDGPA